MTDIQIENHIAGVQPTERLLPSSSRSFDDDEIYVDEPEEVLKTTNSARSEKTLSIEEDEAREAQSKNALPSDANELPPDAAQEAKSKSLIPSEKNELTPNTSITEESSKSVEDGPLIIDLTAYEEEEKKANTKDTEHKKDEDKIELKTEDKPLETKTPTEESRKPKRKSKRASSSKRVSSKPRKPKQSIQKSDEETDNKEMSAKKKPTNKKSVKKVAPSNPVESPAESPADGESSRPIPKAESPPVIKTSESPKTSKAPPAVPTTPKKQAKDVSKKSSPKAKVDPDDFLKRKAAKEKRADELRNYLSGVGDTLMVEPRSDDSVSFLTIPQVLQGEPNHHVDLNKLPKSQQPPRTVNPMISMGDDGEGEAERRISYDLEALMSHQVPPKPKQNKWDTVSVITDDVETVLGENENAEIVSLQSNGIKIGQDSSNKNEFEDVDLEQPSKQAVTAVGDSKSESRTSVMTVLEDLQNLMIRRPIAASGIFVFLVATLVFLGIALMQ